METVRDEGERSEDWLVTGQEDNTLEGRRQSQKQDVRKPDARSQDCFCLFAWFVCLFFQDRVSLSSPGWPGMNYIGQDGLEFVATLLP